MKQILDACCGSRMFWFDKNNPKHVEKFIPIIQSEINRTLTIMNDFMEFSKVKLDLDIMDINMLIEENIEKIKRKDILRKTYVKGRKSLKEFFLNLLILLYFRYEQGQNILIIVVNLVIEKWILSLAKKSMDMKI